MNITFSPSEQRRREPYIVTTAPKFGTISTDHMVLLDGVGIWQTHQDWEGSWEDAKIVPYRKLNLTPDADVFNYGAQLFEGAKAMMIEGELYLWRPEMNTERLQRGGARCMIPCPSTEQQLTSIEALIDADRLWTPVTEDRNPVEGASVYIRPVLIGTEAKLGVNAGGRGRFVVYLKMGGPYFSGPAKLWLQDEHHRGCNAGDAKLGGNYAYHVKWKAESKVYGANEVLYLDMTKRFLRETGVANIFVERSGRVTSPPFGDGVLDSNTTKSFLTLSEKDLLGGVQVRQREIGLEELVDGIASGEITGMGMVGNAAVVSPVAGLIIKENSEIYRRFAPAFNAMIKDGRAYKEERGTGKARTTIVEIKIGDGNPSEASLIMFNTLAGIQTGRITTPDENWLRKVERNQRYAVR